MAADLHLKKPSPGDLRLPQTGSGSDLYLQDRRPGDLMLRRPGWRHAGLHARLPAVQSGLRAEAAQINALRLQARLAPLQARLTAQWRIRAELNARLPSLQSRLAAGYDNAVWRGTAAGTRTPWTPAEPAPRRTGASHGATAHLRASICSPARGAAAARSQIRALFADLPTEHTGRRVVLGPAIPTRNDTGAPWTNLDRTRQDRCAPYGPASPAIPPAVRIDWIDLLRTERPVHRDTWQQGTRNGRGWCGDHDDAIRTRHGYCWSWGPGRLRHGWGGPIVITPPEPPRPEPPCPPPGPADLALLLVRDAALALVRCIPGAEPPPGQIIVPIRRVYFVTNTARLVRVSDGAEIQVLRLDAAIDADSWVWSLTAEVPVSAQPLVENDGSGPVELEATINGHAWRFLVESLRRGRAFSKRSMIIGGRGLAARLAEPYAAVRSFTNTADRTAVQLMEDALTLNGVPLGWSIDATGITDWLVTTGAWGHRGSHIAAVNAIAGSIGALVQSDPAEQILHIKPRYPHPPWRWTEDAVPDIVLPEAVVVQEALEWMERPAYNAVYVSGQSQGVLGRIAIAGTAADQQAPMITDPLITHADAARQRGEAILGDTGRQQRLTLSLPIGGDTALPVILPGQFVDYAPVGIALARGIRVDAATARCRQIVDLEVHLP